MNRPTFLQGFRGFTLMETLIAMLLLGVVSAGIISLNGQLFWQSSRMYSLQQATQMQQACVEKLLTVRENAGYNATLDCNDLNALGTGYTLSVTQANTSQACPTGLNCKLVSVSVANTNFSFAAANLLFVNY